MEKAPEPQQQPVYPQPYPQQPYPQPYPYYYPPPPPRKKEDRTIMILVVVIIVIFVVLPIVLSVVLYFWIIGLAPDTYSVPTGSWGATQVQGPTEATLYFGKLNPEPRPTDLVIMVTRNISRQGTYRFTSDSDGRLALAGGLNMGTLRYSDIADNQRVNVGDEIGMTGLTPDSNYIVRMIWEPNGDLIDSTSFSTP